MSYFKEIIKNMETATIYIGKKTKDSIDTIKLKKELYNESRKLSQLYEILGKISYNIHKGETDQVNEIDDICIRIKKQTELINQIKLNTNCFENMGNNDIIENVLDEDSEDDIISNEKKLEPQTETEGYLLLKFCPNCQTGNNPESKKCISCGQVF